MKFSDFNLRTQILLSFVVITTISLALITSIAIGNIGTIGVAVNEESTQALEDQIVTNMQTSSKENAAIIENKFHNAEKSVARIVEATRQLFVDNLVFENITSYYDNETSSIPDAYLDDDYEETISPTTSTVYWPENGVLSVEINDDTNDTINRSAHLDTLLSSIWTENREYVWLYISFDNGIFRNFPGAFVDSDREYNPTIDDGWHIETMQADGDLLYSPPYFDLTQGMVVSLTQAVLDENGDPFAVVGLDFKTSTIQDKVLDVNFLDSGYAALFQTYDYSVVAHPEWNSATHDPDADLPLITDIETTTGGVSALSSILLTKMISGNVGVDSYTRYGEEYFISYAPITQGNGDELYTFLISVPKDEVVAVVADIDEQIEDSASAITASTITMSIITTIVVLLAGLWISNQITKPVQRLTRIATQLTQNITKKNIFEGIDLSSDELNQDDEIGALANSFTEMVQYLRDEQTKKKSG
ncbi:MAG: cache and HAMP domain-containing protein [Candidatus Heimdallarchaeota archaeon]|nr:cache and HAMP domain-containing protein [Candidatus Heimdallarchaeota archaeon]